MKLTITAVARSCPGGQVDPPPGGGSPFRTEKSHPSHQLTNRGREVSEVVATRRLVKFPAR